MTVGYYISAQSACWGKMLISKIKNKDNITTTQLCTGLVIFTTPDQWSPIVQSRFNRHWLYKLSLCGVFSVQVPGSRSASTSSIDAPISSPTMNPTSMTSIRWVLDIKSSAKNQSEQGVSAVQRIYVENQKDAIHHHRLCTAITPFWFSRKHCWIVITPFWLSIDGLHSLLFKRQFRVLEMKSRMAIFRFSYLKVYKLITMGVKFQNLSLSGGEITMFSKSTTNYIE